jgi:peptidoglycan/LPS O-acetylase OafA/YrhL
MMVNLDTPILELISILGVELFFPLSGFVLANQLKKLESNPNSTWTFLLRRWVRTIPPYLVALICAAIIFKAGDLINFLKFVTYTQNIFVDDPSPNFFSVAWSLSVEEWFYFFIPMCLLVLMKFYKHLSNKLIRICLSIILIGIILKIVFVPSPEFWGEEIRRSVIFRIDSICYGVLAFLWKDFIDRKFFIINITLFFVFLFFLLQTPHLLAKNQLIQLIFLPTCSFSFAVILAFLSKFEINKKLSFFGRFLANISYSMYLFHLIFIALFQKFLPQIENGFAIYILTVVVFSTVFYYSFEKPINDARPNY